MKLSNSTYAQRPEFIVNTDTVLPLASYISYRKSKKTPSAKIIATYAIRCLVTEEVYIGSTKNFLARWAAHANSLRNGYHQNPLLQDAFNTYGDAAFTIQVLEVFTTTDDLLLREEIAAHTFDMGDWFNLRIGNQFVPGFNPWFGHGSTAYKSIRASSVRTRKKLIVGRSYSSATAGAAL